MRIDAAFMTLKKRYTTLKRCYTRQIFFLAIKQQAEHKQKQLQ